ncbi:SpoIIE family protein phosphatase [Schlesneria paludicola]|uniref:SpoIIE family protein phosphatase n=1 Tax=Schlesneria paludicola TaxID=360056 RepID=UPI00029AC055|nr:SpoIIE family protein phosphatase [Schlesneria paludicola]
MAFLKVIRGSSAGHLLALTGEKVVLGRHPSCQIVLDNASVSRQHAQILEEDGQFLVEDLRSRNGTQVNRLSIRGKTQLRDGDELRVCDYAFQFLLKASGPSIPITTDSSVNAGLVSSEPQDDNDENVVLESALEYVPAAEGVHNSSVIASMSAESSHQGLRLNIRPEAKLRAILEISKSLGKVLKLADVLPVILKSLFKIFPQVDSGFVLLKEGASETLRVRASHSRRTDDDEVPISMTVVNQAMASGQAILSADVGEDRRFLHSESIAEMQLRSLMCTPLMDGSGNALGVLQLSTRNLSQPFNADDLDLLVSVGAQAGLAVENASMHESLLKQRDLERDMEIATQVQLSFLPSSSPIVPGYEFADFYAAALSIGGDYYDYIRFPDGRVAVVIGDVSGKGVPAALLMARLHAACRYHLFSVQHAEQALNSLNLEMANSDLGYRFITLSIAILDPVRHQVQLASAGHLPPVVRRKGKQCDFVGIRESGMPLGVMADQHYGSMIIPLEPNDAILFYTDGITEALNPLNQLFSKERVQEVIEAGPDPVTELVPALINAVNLFCDDRAQRDDICVAALRRTM